MQYKPDYHLLRLEFETPVRFGDGKGASGLDSSVMTASSDTLFSAVCTEWIKLYGLSSLNNLIEEIESNQINISSLMPWQQEINNFDSFRYFVPRPLLAGKSKVSSGTQIKKKLKKINWIEAGNMVDYLNFVKSSEGDLEDYQIGFGSEVVFDRVYTRTDSEPMPYIVSAFKFLDEKKKQGNANEPKYISGLYFIVSINNSEIFENFLRVIECIGISGIGGKVSSGLGKFIVWDEKINHSASSRALERMLNDSEADYYMLLSVVSPNIDDINVISDSESKFLLKKSSGFTSSEFFCNAENGNPLKRKNCILLKEGSCFSKPLDGLLLNLSYGGMHPVYRLAKAFNLGLKL